MQGWGHGSGPRGITLSILKSKPPECVPHVLLESSQELSKYIWDEKDDRLADICSAAKDQGVVVFTIGFEVTDHSASVMRNCASTPNHFYRVEGLDIEYAFASIANQINQLKLTQ